MKKIIILGLNLLLFFSCTNEPEISNADIIVDIPEDEGIHGVIFDLDLTGLEQTPIFCVNTENEDILEYNFDADNDGTLDSFELTVTHNADSTPFSNDGYFVYINNTNSTSYEIIIRKKPFLAVPPHGTVLNAGSHWLEIHFHNLIGVSTLSEPTNIIYRNDNNDDFIPNESADITVYY